MGVSTALVVLAFVFGAINLATDAQWAAVCCVLSGWAWCAAMMFKAYASVGIGGE